MAVTWVFLLIVALAALIVLGAVLGLVLLFTNPTTRPIGLALLAVPMVAVIVGFLAWFSLEGQRDDTYHRLARDAADEARAVANEARAAAVEEGVAAALESEGVREAADTAAESVEGEEATGGEPAAAEDRPEWVDAAPGRVGGAYQMAIMVGPYSTRLECDAKLPDELQKAIEEYVGGYIGPEASGRARLRLDYIEEQIVKEEWQQTKRFSVGPMVQLHVLLEFDREVNAHLREEWDKAIVAERLAGVGMLAVVGLLLLSTVYAYLRTDLATGGAYRGRLRLAAGAAILAVISAAVWLVAA